ncbi:alpha beta-hydrolase [Stemphylium lycopersici]|uniref:Alpha beta-hydrolase n=1 Tax=Stemphylium lycopersici TaxID=183478 RepID=A0A364MRT9_STELY|nr:alpha beta-hydrolase [Stemphylium lycopersici]RAR01390.1 alpha beta-hydrolase [Stemphylium lycopersici]
MPDEKALSSANSDDVDRQEARTRFTTTYRLSHIPSLFTSEDIRKLFENADQEKIRDPISLAYSIYITEANQKVATITFSQAPESVHELKALEPNSTIKLVASADAGNHCIQLDNHFEGLTALSNPEPQNVIADDLTKIRETSAEKSRPLILVGHSLGGILIKGAFVKASQNEAYSALRDTIGGLAFFGTPHEGIQNEDWTEIWGDEPSSILIRDLKPGSSFLRELGESFKQHLLQEKVLTIFEHQESQTIFRKEDDEKAACIHVANESRVGINADHSKIAKLQKDEGNPYHEIKDKLRDIVSHANDIIFFRIRRKSILGVLLGLQAYFQHVSRTSKSTSALLNAASLEMNALCVVLDQPGDVLLGLKPQKNYILAASKAADRLRAVFSAAILEASSHDGALRNQLEKLTWNAWSSPGILTGPVLATTPMCMEDLINAAVPLILDLNESLIAALSAQDPSILRGFIGSQQAMHLGLDLVVLRRELLSQVDISPAQPSAGRLTGISERDGLLIGTFYAEDGSRSRLSQVI